MNHVLEHVGDSVTALRRCFRLCAPGGLIGIVVPNWRALGHRVFRRTSVREWATAWRKSWRYRTGRRSPRLLLATWGALTSLATLVVDDAGEELFARARKP
jgi:2-polyprenyl-3-methyl-5-hydroxy-6-metoxy-1,4-benzoquinol methylase